VSSLPFELHSAEFEGTALPTEDQSEEPKRRARRANRARHGRKCTVCHHKDREFIDQDYLRWLSPKKIAREYKISHHSAVYRHADATGLRAQRRASLRATLENFIEQAESVRATAGSVVAAVRLYAQINDQGQWVPPVRRHIVEHRYVDERSQDQPSSGPNQPAAPTTRQNAAINEPPAPLQKTDGSSSVTVAAVSAAPFGASPEKFPAVPVAPISLHSKDGAPSAPTAAANSAAPPAQADKNSGSVDSTRRLQRVATITAGSAVPFSASEDKFPAVPIASINFAPDLPISNREHVELEHAATH
jgi:hypothetical protein